METIYKKPKPREGRIIMDRNFEIELEKGPIDKEPVRQIVKDFKIRTPEEIKEIVRLIRANTKLTKLEIEKREKNREFIAGEVRKTLLQNVSFLDFADPKVKAYFEFSVITMLEGHLYNKDLTPLYKYYLNSHQG